MTLSPDETMKLIKATDGGPLSNVITIACETLTMKIILMLKAKARELSEQMIILEVGSVARANLAGQINALKKFSVELAETE
jgi:hypothetical protein